MFCSRCTVYFPLKGITARETRKCVMHPFKNVDYVWPGNSANKLLAPDLGLDSIGANPRKSKHGCRAKPEETNAYPNGGHSVQECFFSGYSCLVSLIVKCK